MVMATMIIATVAVTAIMIEFHVYEGQLDYVKILYFYTN